jgi:hypothetical protein
MPVTDGPRNVWRQGYAPLPLVNNHKVIAQTVHLHKAEFGAVSCAFHSRAISRHSCGIQPSKFFMVFWVDPTSAIP